ncbi:5-methyltetrahydrofolate--homocysteine methyltransferase [Lachnospiraceae bacterium TWA4]|nr:5-methyltetrahydrofolate--homocysteine methyltransferase [Lachnospiraceae bacterium TWA4]
MEGDKVEVILPELKEKYKDWGVVSLLCDDTGIPKTAEDRLRVFKNFMEKANEFNIAPERIHIDPLIEMLATAEDGISITDSVIREIRGQYPDIHITAAISNISFNLPYRKILNQTFTILSMWAGLDSVIMDPLNRDLMGSILATEAMKGMDEYCMNYISGFREDIFGPVK